MELPVISRRRFLGTGAAVGGALVANAALPSGARAAIKRTRREFGASPHRSALISEDAALHLARRCTYGITPDANAAIAKYGERGWLERQLAPHTISDVQCDRYLRRYPLAGLSSKRLDGHVVTGSFDQMNELTAATFVRQVWSERQLYELMVEFWWNHFNLGLPDSDVWNLTGEFDSVIRNHALGRFDELLAAVAKSPAMLTRLNQNLSVGSNPNENYAREMLELHTVGVKAPYSESEVHNAALLLTGWGLDPTGSSFQFDPANHYVGPISAFEFTAANRSASAGTTLISSYLSHLAHSRYTAQHLATKLAVRFVSDSPPAALVSRLARTYLAHKSEIRPVLMQLFTSSEFKASAGQKVRRPVEAVAASLRVLDYSLANSGKADLADVIFALGIMGQTPLGWPQPNGYPDTAKAWMSASATQAIWATHLRLTGGWWTNTLAFPGVATLLGNPPATLAAGAFVDLVTDRLLFQPITDEHRSVLLSFLQLHEDDPIGSDGLGSAPLLAKVVLDSPYFALR